MADSITRSTGNGLPTRDAKPRLDHTVFTDRRTGATITIFEDIHERARFNRMLDWLIPFVLVFGGFALVFFTLDFFCRCNHG